MQLLIANLWDNPTLTCILPGAQSATRNCLSIAHAEPTPRTKRVRDDDSYSVPVVMRLLTILVNLPPYVSVA